MRIPYTLSSENITVFADGQLHNIQDNNKNFNKVLEELRKHTHDKDKIIQLMSREASLRKNVEGTEVSVENGTVYYKGEVVANTLTDKLINMLDDGFDATPWIKFLDNLMKNPSFRSRNCLYNFLEKFNAPITPDGNFIAFKRVAHDFKDIHSRTFDNSVGKVVKMDRTKVDDDPNHTCSSGLHVCADEYLEHFANTKDAKTVVVEVNPANVVAVPHDYQFAKMRVCEYKVIAEVQVKNIPDILSNQVYDDYAAYYDDGYEY